MATEATGIIPKMPYDYAKTLVNRAYRDVRRQSLWSFLLFEANWTSPNLVNAGTVAVTQGLNTVQFDGPATAAITAIGFTPSPVTQRQFRIGVGTIYNIWDYDPGTGIATLDRAYQEVSAATASYVIYQCYYPAPMQDFWQWLAIKDMVNWIDLVTTKQRVDIDRLDPQRTVYFLPTHVVPYQVDQNPNSATFGWQLFELWGQPQYMLSYTLYGLRKGVDLVMPSDTVPPGFEDVLMAMVRKYAYEWAEANRTDIRNQGSDFRFLIGDAQADYNRLFREYRRQDRALVDNFRTRLRKGDGFPNLYGWYSSIAGFASPGVPW